MDPLKRKYFGFERLYNTLISLPSDRKLFSNILRLGAGTTIGQALVVVATPIFTRLYSPLEMGHFGVLLAYIMFASVIISLRYDIGIISAGTDKEANYLFAISLLLMIPLSVISGIIFMIFIKYNILSYGIFPNWSVIAIVIVLLFTGIFTCLRCWYTRRGDFTNISRALIFQGIGRSSVPILLGFSNIGWIGLLAGEVSGRALGVRRMIRKAWPELKESIIPWDPIYAKNLIKQYWKYPSIVFPSSLADVISEMLPLPIISYLFGASTAGMYLLVTRVSILPSTLIISSFSDVFHAHLFNTHQVDPNQIRPVYIEMVKKLGIIGLLIFIPFSILAPIFFGRIFGKDWVDSGYLLTIYSPVAYMSLLASPFGRLLIVVNRSELKLYFDALNILVIIVSFFGASYLGFGFYYCMIIYSALYVMTRLFYLWLIWYASIYRNRISIV
jgi:O-antigen/teichoic acid export membrane protein